MRVEKKWGKKRMFRAASCGKVVGGLKGRDHLRVGLHVRLCGLLEVVDRFVRCSRSKGFWRGVAGFSVLAVAVDEFNLVVRVRPLLDLQREALALLALERRPRAACNAGRRSP